MVRSYMCVNVCALLTDATGLGHSSGCHMQGSCCNKEQSSHHQQEAFALAALHHTQLSSAAQLIKHLTHQISSYQRGRLLLTIPWMLMALIVCVKCFHTVDIDVCVCEPAQDGWVRLTRCLIVDIWINASQSSAVPLSLQSSAPLSPPTAS